MTFDLSKLIETHLGEARTLYAQHINPRFAKAMKIVGFDRVYVRAEGAYLWDSEGNQVLDMLAGYGVFNMGRHHGVIRQAIHDFMAGNYAHLVQLDIPVLSGLLAKKLKEKIGYGLDYVYFCSTGAEANETALKFVRRATGRERIVYARSAFHGLTTGALSLNGSEIFKEKFGTLLPSTQVAFGDLQGLEGVFSKGDVAAFFIEPIQGKTVAVPPPGYFKEVTALCRKYGVLLVVDEVQSGMGRTGKFLALHHEAGAEPDIVLLSKSLSGGYIPIAAVVMREGIYNGVFSSLDRAVIHSSTFGKSNLAMAAGLAALHVLEEDQLLSRAEDVGNYLLEGLRAMKDRYPFISDVRGRGLMIGIAFGEPKSFLLKTAWKTVQTLSEDLFCQAITMPLLSDHHILTQVAGNRSAIIKLIPPLILSREDADRFLQAFDKVMSDLHRFPGPAWESLTRIAKNSVL